MKATKTKIAKINALTGGTIRDYQIEDYKPAGEGDTGILKNSFVAPDGTYIGTFHFGWQYVLNGLKVCADRPLGTAEKYENDKLIGYLGYSHRAQLLFVLGDKLFDSDYVPVEADFTKEQWAKILKEAWEEGVEELSDVVPFKLRGTKTITTLEEAKQAAINFSKYVS